MTQSVAKTNLVGAGEVSNSIAPTAHVLTNEIAEALGRDKRSIEKRASNGLKRAGEAPWPAYFETVQGGRRKYFVLDELPQDVQTAVRKKRKAEAYQRALDAAAAKAQATDLDPHERAGVELATEVEARHQREAQVRRSRKEEGLKRFSALPKDSDKYKRAKAREWFVLCTYEYQRDNGIGAQQSRAEITEAVNCGSIHVPAHVVPWIPCRDGVRRLTARTLENWVQAYEKGGIGALTDGYGKRRGQSKIASDPVLFKTVLGSMIRFPHIKGSEVREYLKAVCSGIDIPSVRSIQRFMRDWKEENAQIWTFMTNPDRWKNVYMAAAGSHFEQITDMNQLWEMDSTPGDWLLEDGRHSVIGVIDLHTRRLKLYVSKTSKAMAVCQLFRRAVLDWGVPEGVRTDNGKDYVSEQFSGVLRDMEIVQEVCIPFASEEKGTIERALQTMSHGILDLLPGFIGHSVADRKQIEARKSFAERIMQPDEVVEVAMTSAELQERLDQWVEHIYSHNPHSGLSGKTPFECVSACKGPIRRIEDERVLDMLLAEVAGTRTISKKGVRFNHHTYFNDSLFEYAGREAMLKYDEHDLGRLYAYVEGAFVGVLTCYELLGISKQEAAVAAKAKQKRLLSEQSREYKAMSKDVSENIADVVLEHRIAESEKLAAFPKREERYTSAGLDEAALAAQTRNPNLSIPQQDPEQAARAKAALQNAKKPEGDGGNVISMGTAKEKYERWLELDNQVRQGMEIKDERQLRFYENFPGSPEYVGQKELAEMHLALKARNAK
ncbi:DDE-type integrase/transposase/recombinase [Marinobacterium litorale]|uniref:DDE-type integrase/transposase/recombinase n=1 Tax=Marinobacterium litorale TaxID=404770 RepID=UPI0004823FB6|nr:DDE-type integrase/transposase/recombinase [Marinobacterium litorale]